MKQQFPLVSLGRWLHDKTLLRSGLGISLLLLTGVGAASYFNTRQLAANRYWVEHTYQVVQTISQVDSGIKDAERGRRGYILTQNQEFLQIYRNGIQTTQASLHRLGTLTADNPQQQQRLAVLHPLVKERMRSLEQSIDLSPSNLEAQAALTNQGIQVQRTIQTLLREMENEEQALLQQRSQATDASLAATKLINILGYGFSFALLTLIYVLLEQEIRQRKQAEIAIKQYAEEVEDLYNNAPCGYHSLDAAGILVQINHTELKWLGYERSEVMGKKFTDFLTPESQHLFLTQFAELIEQGWSHNLELEVRCKDGSILPVEVNATALKDASGHYLRSRSTLMDIRERKQAEAALRTSEARFRSLSEAAPIGIFMADAQGYTTYVNRRAQEICGYSLTESLGYGWMQSVHPDDFAWMLTQWRSDCAEMRGSIYNDIRFVHRDGSIRYGRIQSAPIVDANRVLAFVGTIEDITESRMVAQLKNEFVSTVSHELRTPLTAIRGSLGLLAAGVYDRKPDKAKRMVQVASEQSDRLVRLINDILDFQRLESGKVRLVRQSCNAATLLQQAVETMRPSAEQNQITFCLRVASIQLWAAPDAILQTLTNLLSNAIKFSPAQTTLYVSVELVGAEPDSDSPVAMVDPPDCSNGALPSPAHLPSSPPPYALFAVHDQGRGIPADKLELIFEQFQQVDASDSRQKGGTGLGLAICRKIVEQHGGKIWAESALGEGSSFYFTLPIVPNA